jgi:glycerate kinase
MSDGGEGFGEIIGGMMGGRRIDVLTVDCAGAGHPATFWWIKREETAVIETAEVNGLARLPPGKFHPFDLDTFGLGKIFGCAGFNLGVKKAIVGIGGSATNDGGFGLARSLGWKFLSDRDEISAWTELDRLQKIEMPSKRIDIDLTIACDVQNPLLGPNGCSRIYGPQKGLREQDMLKAESCLARLAEVSKDTLGNDFAREPGTGAAGGLGFGLRAFLNGKFVPGFEVFAEACTLDDRLKDADIVISGEGAIDSQSLMGKGVGALFQRARQLRVKRIGLAGSLAPDVKSQFAHDANLLLLGIVPDLASLDQAKAQPAKYLSLLASEAAKKHASA